LITEFERKIENRMTFVDAISHGSRMTPCLRDVDLRNSSRQEGERESTPAKQHQGKARATKT
jgi:hypothetical protein